MKFFDFLLTGFIEESVGRIEEATAGAAVARQPNSDQSQGQTETNSNSQGEGHTLGGNNIETEQQPSAKEMREKRLAFFNKSQDNVVNENSVQSSGDSNEHSHGKLAVPNNNGKAPSKYCKTVGNLFIFKPYCIIWQDIIAIPPACFFWTT